MAYFTNDFMKFFLELERNNRKDWFDENRKRYQTSVKDPFYSFVDVMIGLINERDSSVQITSKDAVMRINRDIRFSTDKTPYNLHYGAIISSTGRKDKSVPGFFLRFSPKFIGVFGGAHGIDKYQLKKVRTAITEDLKGFKGLVNGKKFKEKFGTIQGEKHKRIPPEFQNAFQKEPLIANKQFYYVAELDADLITEDNLPEILMEYWEISNPVRTFLIDAMG